ncbi:uncharacterized protein LOC142220950 [Haematobia irritans]|uniref:uncharacterized protein LOC142220950 n=1 Tax=Haematobia irritans TaxID=7368 RepID=UPI003F500753
MKNLNPVILPHVVEILSHKPNSCETIENLCIDVQNYLSRATEGFNSITDIRKDLTNALHAGKNIGVISIANNVVRLPFSFRDVATKVNDTIRTFSSTPTNHSLTRRKQSLPKKLVNLESKSSRFLMLSPRRYTTVLSKEVLDIYGKSSTVGRGYMTRSKWKKIIGNGVHFSRQRQCIYRRPFK